MAKSKSVYVCQNCGAKRAKWEGRCSDCDAWNTFVEEKSAPKAPGWVQRASSSGNSKGTIDVYNLMDTPPTSSGERSATGIGELDRVLGGGLVKGSYILLGGDPGIGKSTLIMQAAGTLAARKHKVLYISAEESVQQTAMRARRLGVQNVELQLASESSLDLILESAKSEKPDVLIIDSIQTVHFSHVESAPGSVSQVRECAAQLLSFAKTSGTTVILIGHVTKDGSLAGPRVLEHMVDTVLAFEGDHHQQFRLLRALKNRFGATNELGVFQMANSGLQEVPNPSAMFLEERRENQFGSAVFSAMEGSRPLLCEIQALTTVSPLPSPRRTSIGIDINRVHMLVAVIEKYTRFSLANRDVYANVVGGLRLSEPAADLSLMASLLSSESQNALPKASVFIGEVGLTGEIRGASLIVERLKECSKLGFERVYLPKSNQRFIDAKAWDLELGWLQHVRDLEKLMPSHGRRSRAPNRDFDAEA